MGSRLAIRPSFLTHTSHSVFFKAVISHGLLTQGPDQESGSEHFLIASPTLLPPSKSCIVGCMQVFGSIFIELIRFFGLDKKTE
jgi:hypothetical protein